MSISAETKNALLDEIIEQFSAEIDMLRGTADVESARRIEQALTLLLKHAGNNRECNELNASLNGDEVSRASK